MLRILMSTAILIANIGMAHAQSSSVNILSIQQANDQVEQLYRSGNGSEALFVAKKVMEQAERTLGAEHPDTLKSIANLAFLYKSQGSYVEAELLYKRALDAQARILGKEHPETLKTAGNLVHLYQFQARHDQAQDILNLFPNAKL